MAQSLKALPLEMEIPVGSIAPRTINCNELDDETFNGLVEDIKANGLRYPVLVRQTGPDSYEFVDGEHRWLAAKKLGWGKIKAKVVEMGDEEAEVANFKLNSERGHANPVKVALLFDKEKNRGLSQEEIGKKYNLSQQRVSQYLDILSFSEEIRHLLTSRLVKFTMEHARRITDMLNDPELQVQVARKVVDEGLSVRETEAEISALLKDKRKEEDWTKRKEELMEIIDFSTRNGAWKSEHCKHRDKDGYCRQWMWSNEPIDWKEKLTWLETCEIEGKWYSKASPKACALCEAYSKKGGELDQLQASIRALADEVYGPLRSLSSAYMSNGRWKKGHCSYHIGGYCRNWQWDKKPNLTYMIGEPAVEPDGTWLVDPTPQYCATCPSWVIRTSG